MALTNFSKLSPDEKKVWSRKVWMQARNASFAMQFTGKGANSMIQRVTELTKDEKGERAIISLVTDLQGDGIGGDRTLEGKEEAINSYEKTITIDQLRNANRHEGRMANQKSVISFRDTSKDLLSYWAADRIDQMAFLAMSGKSFSKTNDGRDRAAVLNAAGLSDSATTMQDLAFAGDVEACTSERHLMWTGELATGDEGAAFDNAVNPSYKMLVEAKAYAKDNYIRGIKGPSNTEFYHVFMTPQGLAKLKQDGDFLSNLRNAGVRGANNPLFSGSLITQDGLIIHEFRHVYNTRGAAPSEKWGTDGLVDGQAVLLCGAQAMAFADRGLPYWVEKGFDYDNQQGVSIGKIFGMMKPKFHSIYAGSTQDFGVVRIDTKLAAVS